MEDIIIIDPEQTEYEQIDIYDSVSEDQQDVETIDKIEKIEKVEEEIIGNESKQVNKSDGIILGSDVNNNLRSSQNITIDFFDSDSLWVNNFPDKSFSGQNINLINGISVYDFIGIRYKSYADNRGNESINIISVNDLINNVNGNDCRFSVNSSNNGTYIITREVKYINDNVIYFSDSYNIRGTNNTPVLANGTNIPLEVYGLKSLTLSNNDIPVVSGNNITNNYYITVSGNDSSLSYNLLNKPLNNYSISESILLFIFMGLFVAGFSWFIKKNIFKL